MSEEYVVARRVLRVGSVVELERRGKSSGREDCEGDGFGSRGVASRDFVFVDKKWECR
jgi:hypothetical protein